MSEFIASTSAPSDEKGLAAIVRDYTKVAHRAAERAGFVADLLRGRATVAGYALFIRNLHPVYAALEEALEAAPDHPITAVFTDRRIHRLAALESDLNELGGPDWATLPLLPQATAYAAAIANHACFPASLAGHAYARYLGDLSGGQILKPLLARTLQIPIRALGFYDFPDIIDIDEVKAGIRASIDRVPAGGRDAHAMCDAALAAFTHNIALSEAVQSSLATA